MLTARLGRVIAGKVGYTAACLLAAVVLVVSGYAHKVVGYASGFNDGIFDGQRTVHAHPGDEHPGHGPGEPDQLLRAGAADLPCITAHAHRPGRRPGPEHADPHPHLRGRPEGGRLLDPARRPGQLPAARSTSTASTFPTGRSTSAYDWAYTESLSSRPRHLHSSSSDYLLANQAGEQAEIKTVESVTGVHDRPLRRDRTWPGSTTLAQAFGGVEVCLKPRQGGFAVNANLTDTIR